MNKVKQNKLELTINALHNHRNREEWHVTMKGHDNDIHVTSGDKTYLWYRCEPIFLIANFYGLNTCIELINNEITIRIF